MAWTQGWLNDIPGEKMKQGNSCMMRIGWFKSTGATTGGDIETGFPVCYLLLIQPHAAAVGSGPVVNEAVADVEAPYAGGGTVSIITDAAEVGRWIAWGN